ncbi:MAG: hypothetical protein K5756_04560 [Clostridiales bacterium]|nr:hypothetical protein [Clostridiales bacterium]
MKIGTVTLICFIIAGIFFVISIIIFFILDLKRVIGDLTGYTAKREIAKIRSQNQESGVKVYKSSKVNAERGKITDKISDLNHSKQRASGMGLGTEKISNYVIPESVDQGTTVLGSDAQSSADEETTLLDGQGQGTTLLSSSYDKSTETTVLDPEHSETAKLNTAQLIGEKNETTLLDYAGNNETTVLGSEQIRETTVLNDDASEIPMPGNAVFKTEARLDQEIVLINTSEIVY